MNVNAGILLTLFGQHQPYGEALKIPCDLLLEIVESQLDEGLSYLEGDSSRLARKSIAITKAHGSVRNMVREELKEKREPPNIGTMEPCQKQDSPFTPIPMP